MTNEGTIFRPFERVLRGRQVMAKVREQRAFDLILRGRQKMVQVREQVELRELSSLVCANREAALIVQSFESRRRFIKGAAA